MSNDLIVNLPFCLTAPQPLEADCRKSRRAIALCGIDPPGSKPIAYEYYPRRRSLQTCIGEPKARIKNAVPSKKHQRCCGEDTVARLWVSSSSSKSVGPPGNR